MVTQVIKVASAEYQTLVRGAGNLLDRGGLVVIPTETVYGLAARADVPAAMGRLREVKGRDVQQGFTVHVPHREDVKLYVAQVPPLAARLIRKAWPGPLTLLLEVEEPEKAPILVNRDSSAREAIYYQKTVGLRCPDDAVARAVLEQASGPVVAAMNVGLQAARVDREKMVRDYLPALRAAAEEVGMAIGHARL